MKICSKCHVEKAEQEFNWKVKDVRRTTVCKSCHKEYRRTHYLANRQKYIDKARKWEADNGGKRTVRHNISEQAWIKMVERYGGLCWLCRKRPGTCLDHDHSCCSGDSSCGRCVRGILCVSCNTALGKLGDNKDGLLRAIAYLDEADLRNRVPMEK